MNSPDLIGTNDLIDPTARSNAFAAHVWNELANIDVGDYTKTIDFGKRAATYLPWHRAWMLVKRIFPGTAMKTGALNYHADGTAEVEMHVYITNAANPFSACPTDVVMATATLPVMDNRYNAVQNPDSRAISDARARCVTKALAYAGLGLNLWADDYRPVGKLSEPISAHEYKSLLALVDQTNTDTDALCEWAGIEQLADLPTEKFARARSFLEKKVSS